MLIFRSKQICVLAISACIIGALMMQSAGAALISTETAIEMTERQDRIDHINEVLARKSVQSMLVRYGVESADASA
ncbi:MAG: PA2779 family protein, partial [Gammaproteobacteria bacterium]|nr:PA2779 family protein [Gammaproteobacteria bacterium]